MSNKRQTLLLSILELDELKAGSIEFSIALRRENTRSSIDSFCNLHCFIGVFDVCV